MKLAKSLSTLASLSLSIGLMGCTPAPKQNDQIVSPSTQHLENYLTRDVREDVFYFVMPDRFYNGDPSNDLGAPEGSISHGGFDPSSKWAFHGGDMQGIEQKLDYLKGMGITAIWMTPILRNKAVQKDGFAHHGYWIVDFGEVDPHFGSNADLKQLITAAHQKGIKVFFDIITNHTADVVKYRECHDSNGTFIDGLTSCEYRSLDTIAKTGTYTPFVPDTEQGVKSPAWLNDPSYYHNQGDTTFEGENSLYGDFNGLDDINTEDPRVVQGMIDIYSQLISEFKPDGFRVDTVRHVQLPFWQAFSPAIMAHAQQVGIPNFHIFGEVYDPDPRVLSEFTTTGKLPAVLDFGFQAAVGGTFFANKPVSQVSDLLDQDHLYNDEDSNVNQLLTFLGNHDMGRPGHFIARDLPNISSEEKLKRSILAHAMMFVSRGIPVVYYGDEQGFTGDGHDVDAREDMMPSSVASYNDNTLLGTSATTAQSNFDTDHPIYRAISEFAVLRKSIPLLSYGDQRVRWLDNQQQAFTFVRADEQGNEVYIAFNLSPNAQVVPVVGDYATLSLVGGDAKLIGDDDASILLAPLSFGVFTTY